MASAGPSKDSSWYNGICRALRMSASVAELHDRTEPWQRASCDATHERRIALDRLPDRGGLNVVYEHSRRTLTIASLAVP